jgi:DNA-binding MarR family transcriptional regulator
MSHGAEPGHAPSQPRFTQKQGQYLAFIHTYTLVLSRPPAEADLQRHFRVTPPSVHQMIITLERAGLVRRKPGVARSIQLLIYFGGWIWRVKREAG